jgi:galactosylceramidase
LTSAPKGIKLKQVFSGDYAMLSLRVFLGIVYSSTLLVTSTIEATTPIVINLRGSDTGRAFEGVGAVSAGASTRLLFDYTTPYRNDVLDFLFKPRFGAGFQHLKVEIGGGENSTCGSEPSHAITRQELTSPKARGYEFWLMKEARNRNPQIMLDCLPWSYPGWLRGRFSQDATDWFIAFLKVARKQYGMEMNWVSAAQNENGTDRNWIVNSVRPTLDACGFRSVKVQAPDCDKGFWAVFTEFETDPAYRKAVEAVGYHYVNGREPWEIDQVSHRETTPRARNSGKQLWASEEWSMSGGKWNGTGAMFLARLINKLYIRDHICKTEIWCPIDSIYDGLPWSDTGAMQAKSPWSGHYTVWPAVWAVAHTTQFAQPGWKYLDHGCGQIDAKTWKGTYVTLKDPSTGDWSMVVCTDGPTTLAIKTADGLKADRVHVWHSDAQTQFAKEADILPVQGVLTISLPGDSIYSVTTTTGQQKGEAAHAIPPDQPFPLPYHDDFESYQAGDSPRYFSDQKGTFEVWDEPGHGKCLKQIVPQQGIMWEYMRNIVKPYTVIGDQRWSDYEFSADVHLDGGDLELGGRYGDQNKLSYRWILAKDGTWKLNYQEQNLATGSIKNFSAARWHSMKILFRGDTIRGYLDGEMLAQTKNSSRSNGMAYLASTYHGNLFDNVKISDSRSNGAD